jgi:hypothetical protein
MYVVAAIAEQPGPPAVRQGRGWHLEPTTEPIGTRHAAATSPGLPPPLIALCGADIDGWVLFPGAPFAAGSTASCQRCAQLVSSAEGRERPAVGG